MPTGITSVKRWRASCATLLALLASHAAVAEISGQVALTSEHIHRGVSWSDGNPALQAGVDYAHDSGFFAGAWASTMDLSNPTGRRNVEVDYYIGYAFGSDSEFPTSVSLMHYTYPDNSSVVNYDYTEALLVTSWKNVSLEYGYSDDLYGFGVTSHRAEFRGDWTLPNAWVFAAGLGFHAPDGPSAYEYLYWDAGVSARFSRVTVDLRWHDSESRQGFGSRWAAGSRAVATLSLAF